MKPEKENYCKKIIYNSENSKSPNTILGILTGETDYYFKFRTAKKDILIAKNQIRIIEDTNQVFNDEKWKER